MRKGLTFWLIAGTIGMFALGIFNDIIFDKSDWIFLFLLIGLIVLNVKLNKILGLLSKGKK